MCARVCVCVYCVRLRAYLWWVRCTCLLAVNSAHHMHPPQGLLKAQLDQMDAPALHTPADALRFNSCLAGDRGGVCKALDMHHVVFDEEQNMYVNPPSPAAESDSESDPGIEVAIDAAKMPPPPPRCLPRSDSKTDNPEAAPPPSCRSVYETGPQVGRPRRGDETHEWVQYEFLVKGNTTLRAGVAVRRGKKPGVVGEVGVWRRVRSTTARTPKQRRDALVWFDCDKRWLRCAFNDLLLLDTK